MTRPRIPLAEPQRGNQPGTWAYHTIVERFPRIASRILDENAYSHIVGDRIKALISDIPEAPIRLLGDPDAPDLPDWDRYTDPFLGQNWHQPPWWFTEHYFYRRIMEATGYFQPGEGQGIDPFSYQKRRGLEVSSENIDSLCTWVDHLAGSVLPPIELVGRLLQLDLWGNQADLSMWPAEADSKPDHTDLHRAVSHILVNNLHQATNFLTEKRPHKRIDFLIDNAGYELVNDLVFSHWLLVSKTASWIRLHVKSHPTYVSDATKEDVTHTIAALCAGSNPHTRSVGNSLKTALDLGHLQIKANAFWTSPLDGWQLPVDLQQELSQASLVISKGDAHYRRLLGDRHWPFETPFDDILSYYPAPVVALRTLKSELVVGLSPGQSEFASQQDPQWLLNGRWGLIQFHSKM